jgi:hypothetical protein
MLQISSDKKATLLLAAALFAISCRSEPPQILDLAGQLVAPLDTEAAVVLLFVQTDCPISNRYAPTIKRLHDRFAGQGATFWLVYPDRREDPGAIRRHLAEYDLPGNVARDVVHALVDRVGATVTPEAAIFAANGALVYRGRIDDRYTDFDKARPQATRHDLEEALQATLAGRTPTYSATQAIGCYIADLK